ncbi:MAG: peptide ABC transporter substrate-binding protein [Dehalococcoidales bacterium]
MKRIIYIILLALSVGSLLFSGCQRPQEAPDLSLYGIDPITLDPAISGEMVSHEYVLQIFGGLVRLDDNLQPAPDIAQRWEVSDDGRTYTFYLRQDVKFHDGRKVKAEDFKYSWERACDPRTGSLTAATYLNDIIGVEEVLAGKAREISGVSVIDDYTLQVTIDVPKSYFLSKLTYPTAFVVDRDNAALGGEWWRQPNGTGPFKLKKWDEESLLALEKNELYYGEPAKVNSVVFQLWGGVPMNMYETGEIDVTSVSLVYIDKVTDKAGPFYQELQAVSELSFSYIGFNATRPPFDDVNVRRAFGQAIDKDKLVSLVFREMVRRADGILPPGMPGFNEGLVGLDYDVNKAKELIAASSYGSVAGLPSITITTSGWGGLISNELEAIIQEWQKNLGVEVKVRQLEPQRFLYHLKEEKDEMYYIGWVADYPHPQNFLEVLFHTDVDNNFGEYSNHEVDALLEAAGVELGNELSLSLYQQAEQKLVDDAACIPLWFGQNYVLIKPYVSGYDLNPMGFAMLNGVSVNRD